MNEYSVYILIVMEAGWYSSPGHSVDFGLNDLQQRTVDELKVASRVGKELVAQRARHLVNHFDEDDLCDILNRLQAKTVGTL